MTIVVDKTYAAALDRQARLLDSVLTRRFVEVFGEIEGMKRIDEFFERRDASIRSDSRLPVVVFD